MASTPAPSNDFASSTSAANFTTATSNTGQSETASTSSTRTSSAVTSGSTGIAADNCTNGTITTTSDGVRYKEFCATDWPNGYGALGRDLVQYVQALTAYASADCINACDTYNAGSPGECQGVTCNTNLTSALRFSGGNCILKSAQADENSEAELCASAAIVS